MSKKSSSGPLPAAIYASFGLKSAVGKSTLIRCAADLLDATGGPWRGVSVDRSDRLPSRYPGRFAQVQLPTDRDGRLDSYARTRAFAPLDGEIERVAEQGGILLLDIGSGEYPGAVLEHAARARIGALFKRSGMSFTAFIVTTADAVMMTDVPRLINAVLEALPDARIVVALNEKSGTFRFPEISEAQKSWTRDIEPLLGKYATITIPAMAAGTWEPYEDQGLRFSEVALLDPETNLADEKKLIMWARETRGLAIARHGDVAEWLHGAWQALASIVQPGTKHGGDHD
ncbi:hypothetical protein [Bradyrhizobium sp. Mp27]|uniref:hypothetical protein n=1 Tax=Bradyrhizobium sp. Mp27 TaxID=3042157 RepID=UPI00248D14DB|nr:hypothetical protein [Bradyrhizobium sp. Mp27]MDI2076151.1 hypothetical protein [Bradyrhizobium sp. Mp27]